MTLKSLGLNKFKEQAPFQKTYIETQLFAENSLVQKSSLKLDLDIQNLFKIRNVSLKHYLIVEISLSMIQKYF